MLQRKAGTLKLTGKWTVSQARDAIDCLEGAVELALEQAIVIQVKRIGKRRGTVAFQYSIVHLIKVTRKGWLYGRAIEAANSVGSKEYKRHGNMTKC